MNLPYHYQHQNIDCQESAAGTPQVEILIKML